MHEGKGQHVGASLPGAYERWRASRLGCITDRIEQRVIFELAGPVAGRRVLDAGCGDGQLAALLASAGARVTAVDSDERMLGKARERLEAAGLRAELARGDVRALPFADATFDVVMAVTVLCFVDDVERAVSEMARVLKPGGRLVIGELGRYSLWAALRRLRGWMGHATWRAARFRGMEELRALATGAGLEVVGQGAAIFYPPWAWAASLLAPVDGWLGRHLPAGGAFLAIAAVRPASQTATGAAAVRP